MCPLLFILRWSAQLDTTLYKMHKNIPMECEASFLAQCNLSTRKNQHVP